jgi:hypothetical protein
MAAAQMERVEDDVPLNACIPQHGVHEDALPHVGIGLQDADALAHVVEGGMVHGGTFGSLKRGRLINQRMTVIELSSTW